MLPFQIVLRDGRTITVTAILDLRRGTWVLTDVTTDISTAVGTGPNLEAAARSIDLFFTLPPETQTSVRAAVIAALP